MDKIEAYTLAEAVSASRLNPDQKGRIMHDLVMNIKDRAAELRSKGVFGRRKHVDSRVVNPRLLNG